jgi:hypothetical protein
MSTARERHQKRRQTRTSMASRPRDARQVQNGDGFKMPDVRLPFPRWFLLIPLALIIIVLVVLVLGLINPPEAQTAPNAIWLDSQTTHRTVTDDELSAWVQDWRENQIGTVYVFVSSLKPDNTWSGILTQTNRIQEVEPLVSNLRERIQGLYPDMQIFAWIEVVADTPEYRLNSPQVQTLVADLSARLINTLNFEGVFLDVKPLFDGNEDLLVLLRKVRGSIGLDTPLAVSVPADLTPTGTDLVLPTFIAPGTVWSSEYKQRVSLQADQIIVTAYNSYITDPVGYIEWVSYQVTAFTQALSEMDTTSQILISVPNYTLNGVALNPSPHDPRVESMAGALDGVIRALPNLTTQQRTRLQGVAIFTDVPLTDNDWAIFRDKWLNAPKTAQP